jgi:leader peptidase (prepilin peptidase)/N-methyltransferase
VLTEALLAALFGLLIGSFLNVCIYRLPRDLSVVWPRSFCPECSRPIAWYDNIPLLSVLILGGKCRYCQAPIFWRYPVVELLTAASFFSAVVQHGLSGAALRLAVLSALLIALAFTDMEDRILPDEITVGGTAVGWLLALVYPMSGGLVTVLLPPDRSPAGESLAGAVLGGAIPAFALWAVGGIYQRVRGREGVGFGDVKMLLMLGAFLGLETTMLTVIAASVFGSLAGLAMVAIKGREASLYELPFGSFLAAAALAIAHFGWNPRLY